MWNRIFTWFVKITAWLPQWICFRTKIYYENKKLQGRHLKGKAVIISNHRSIYDIAMMMFLFPTRTLRPLIAEIMFKQNPLLSFFLKSLGGIEVDRNSHDFSFVESSCRLLDKGGIIEIYPESRLPKKDEEIPLPFKPSAAYIALLSNAPIIPVFTNGKYFSKSRARVIIGTPIYVRELYDDGSSEQENLQNISEYLRKKIIGLENELNKQSKEKQKEEQKILSHV